MLRFTVTVFCISVPSDTLQTMVKVVACVMGTVAAPPESEFWLKLPTEDVSTQLNTPCVFQKIEVRPPRGTEAGTAQISALGVTLGVEVAGVVVAAGAGFGFDVF